MPELDRIITLVLTRTFVSFDNGNKSSAPVEFFRHTVWTRISEAGSFTFDEPEFFVAGTISERLFRIRYNSLYETWDFSQNPDTGDDDTYYADPIITIIDDQASEWRVTAIELEDTRRRFLRLRAERRVTNAD